MTEAERSAAQAAQQIATALEAEGISYAIGGALALAVAGVPRGTADVDVNVFVNLDRIDVLIEVLDRLGIEIEKRSATERFRSRTKRPTRALA